MIIERGTHWIYGPEWRITIWLPWKATVWNFNIDGLERRWRRLYIGVGRIPFVKYAFHLRVVLQ